MLVVAGVTIFAGCLPQVQSSRAILGPYLSQAEVSKPPPEAGLEVVRLFANRGQALVAQAATQSGLVMQLKTNPGAVDRRHDRVSSVFAVVISEAPGGHSVVRIDGSPAIAGTDARAEAEVVHGVFSELALEGLTVPMAPDSPAMRQADADALARCVAQQRAVLDDAADTQDPIVREHMVQSAPICR